MKKFAFFALFATIMLTACGQKGALYLPEKPTTPTQTTEPEISTNPNDY